MNVFDEMRTALDEAQARFRAADDAADRIARMLIGRLSKVNSVSALSSLKRELRDFNIHTGKWKQP